MAENKYLLFEPTTKQFLSVKRNELRSYLDKGWRAPNEEELSNNQLDELRQRGETTQGPDPTKTWYKFYHKEKKETFGVPEDEAIKALRNPLLFPITKQQAQEERDRGVAKKQSLAAGIEGVVRGVLPYVGDKLMNITSKDKEREQRMRQYRKEENPKAAIGGEIGGSVIGLKGVGAIGKAAATKIAPRLAGKVAQAAGSVSGRIATGVGEGAALGAQSAAGQIGLYDDQLTSDQAIDMIVDDVRNGALFGLGLSIPGVIGKGLGKAWTNRVNKYAQSADAGLTAKFTKETITHANQELNKLTNKSKSLKDLLAQRKTLLTQGTGEVTQQLRNVESQIARIEQNVGKAVGYTTELQDLAIGASKQLDDMRQAATNTFVRRIDTLLHKIPFVSASGVASGIIGGSLSYGIGGAAASLAGKHLLKTIGKNVRLGEWFATGTPLRSYVFAPSIRNTITTTKQATSKMTRQSIILSAEKIADIKNQFEYVDPEIIRAQTVESLQQNLTAPIFETPEQRQEFINKVSNHQSTAASILKQAAMNIDENNEQSKQRFNNLAQAIENPDSIIERIISDIYTTEDIKILKFLLPQTFEDLKQQLIMETEDENGNIKRDIPDRLIRLRHNLIGFNEMTRLVYGTRQQKFAMELRQSKQSKQQQQPGRANQMRSQETIDKSVSHKVA